MNIKKLTLDNYRGAPHLELKFHPRLNVFYGVNGSGKSTMLDAIAILLSWVVSRIRHAGTSGRHIVEEDISNGRSVSILELDCVCTNDEQTINWKLVKTRSGHSSADERSVFSELNKYTEELREKITQSNEQVNLPLFAYYPVNRAVLDIPLRIKEKHRFNFLSTYDNSLTSGADFRTFFEWFREREDLENENRKYIDQANKPDDFQFPDPQLETVRHALEKLMPEFKNLTVRRNPLRMEVEKNGKPLTVNQLSDGEKCLMAMVGDLARRMAIANPVRDNPLDGEGIILIDEIDLHLHPKWQRMIVPKLLNLFSNCQFIVSTHSPHIITHVQAESLCMLQQVGSGIIAERPSESYGKNVDRVLEDLMGLNTTRPDKVNDRLKLLYTEIDHGKLSEARQIIKEMKSEIGDDPELVKAEVLIKRQEIIGK